MLGVYGSYVGPMLIHVRLLEAMLDPYSAHVELMLSQERRVPFKSSKFEGVTRSRDACRIAATGELQFWRCCAQEVCWSRASVPLSPVSRQLNERIDGEMQLGLRCNWRISMLQVLHAGNLLCARVFIMRAGFRSPFSGFWLKWRNVWKMTTLGHISQ